MQGVGDMSDKIIITKIIDYPEDMIAVNDEFICVKREEFSHKIVLYLIPKSVWLSKNKEPSI